MLSDLDLSKLEEIERQRGSGDGGHGRQPVEGTADDGVNIVNTTVNLGENNRQFKFTGMPLSEQI